MSTPPMSVGNIKDLADRKVADGCHGRPFEYLKMLGKLRDSDTQRCSRSAGTGSGVVVLLMASQEAPLLGVPASVAVAG